MEYLFRSKVQDTFRASWWTFNFILNCIEPFIVREIVTEEPIPAELRLDLCLYALGMEAYLYTIAEISELDGSTVCSDIHEVHPVLIGYLWNENVSSHISKTREVFKKKMLDMEEVWQFPYCWAAIDVCHIPLKCPSGGLMVCKECHNFKNFYSVVLMGVVQSSTHSLQYVAPGNQPSKQHVAQESSKLYSQALIHCSMLHLETSILNSTLHRETSKLCSGALIHCSMLHLETSIPKSALHRATSKLCSPALMHRSMFHLETGTPTARCTGKPASCAAQHSVTALCCTWKPTFPTAHCTGQPANFAVEQPFHARTQHVALGNQPTTQLNNPPTFHS